MSVVGRTADDFRVDSFDVSYGDPQTVAVVAKRALEDLSLHYYSINGGATQTADVSEWSGGSATATRTTTTTPSSGGKFGGEPG